MTILRIDSSSRQAGSVSRALADQYLSGREERIVLRDVGLRPLPVITADWMNANWTASDKRSVEQTEILQQSDMLISELEEAEEIVISVPIYNFGVPAALKAWIDLICRAGRTFQYTADGPQGLLRGKTAMIFLASGGTKFESPIDFCGPYLRHVLSFVGIEDVTCVAADALMGDPEGLKAAHTRIKHIIGA